jgi:hypothetical protein
MQSYNLLAQPSKAHRQKDISMAIYSELWASAYMTEKVTIA